MRQRAALVVGASRGLGLGVTERLLERGWAVTATRRSTRPGDLDALAERWPGRLTLDVVDIDDEQQVGALHDRIDEGSLDLVLVVAGTTHDRWETVAEVSTATFERLMVTNALSPARFVERFRDRVREDGTIAVMSSGQGSIANNTRVTGWEVYRASKAALNQLVRSIAARNPDETRTMLLVAPGWVRTSMGGQEASLSVEESTGGVVDVLESRAGRGGLAFVDHRGDVVPW